MRTSLLLSVIIIAETFGGLRFHLPIVALLWICAVFFIIDVWEANKK